MNELTVQFFTLATDPMLFIFEPQKRIFWLYLVSAAALAALLTAINKKGIVQGVKQALAPSLWLSKSSRVDFQWLFINHFLWVLLIIPLIGGQLAITLLVNRSLNTAFGTGDFFQLPQLQVACLFTIVFFLTEDFTRFMVHYLFHKVPFLWRFHAIHHSAEVLTPITLYRVHSLEALINGLRSLLTTGIVSGLFVYLFYNKITFVDILGVNVFHFLFNIAGSNLRHSSVWFGFGWLEHIFISPAQHQIHHSAKPEHFDKNMGSTLAIWDKLFKTLTLSKSESVSEYGLGDKQPKQSVLSQLLGVY